MLNGQNNFNAGGPSGNGGFPNMVGSQGGAQGMQYGMGPGARGMQGQAPRPTRAASLCPASARKARWAGYGYGRAGGMQSPFGNPMGQGNGLSSAGGLLRPRKPDPARYAGTRGERDAGRGPPVAARGQRQRRVRADGRSSRRDDGRRGKLRSARRRHPAADGTRGAGGVGGGGADLLAMINKQQGAQTCKRSAAARRGTSWA